jgi:hypothetical protein
MASKKRWVAVLVIVAVIGIVLFLFMSKSNAAGAGGSTEPSNDTGLPPTVITGTSAAPQTGLPLNAVHVANASSGQASYSIAGDALYGGPSVSPMAVGAIPLNLLNNSAISPAGNLSQTANGQESFRPLAGIPVPTSAKTLPKPTGTGTVAGVVGSAPVKPLNVSPPAALMPFKSVM